MQFSIVAYDFTDSEALDRRLSCRAAHAEGLRNLFKEGKFIAGAALLDDSGKMIGSNAFFEFETREALDEWLQTEPYIVGRVWDKVEIREVKVFNPNA
ncbi:MAG: YciI family protein [Pseudomonas sp.]|uniref:YciI family protein n=1 Tax=Pseudomonas sp. TaxID=306 RepID=UPI003D14325B